MQLRVLDFGSLSPLRSQAVYHGIAEIMSPDAVPVLVLASTNAPYVCVGMHQNIDLEIDKLYCAQHSLPILRRHVGGGTVFLDQNQLFFQFIFPRQLAPRTVEEIYPYFIETAVQTYQRIGINAYFQAVNDIHVSGKKIGGTGVATINHATVFAGSFIIDFDFTTMANAVQTPSKFFRRLFARNLPNYMTTIRKETKRVPDRQLIKRTFINAIADVLHTDIILSEPSIDELDAIAIQECELADVDWLDQDGKRLVQNGIKIAANTHLTEHALTEHSISHRIVLLEKNHRIENLWIETQQEKLAKRDWELGAELRGAELNFDEIAARLNPIQHKLEEIAIAPTILAESILAATHHY